MLLKTIAHSPLSEADREALASLLFPDAAEVAAIAAQYPPRTLAPTATVTRFAPSPTGFIHIGSVMAALLNWKLAQQSDGVFILRIEDTDRRREVEDGVVMIVRALTEVGLSPDEGPIATAQLDETGAYGPYIQSRRQPIYQAYARDLVRRGLAYPCFMGEAELEEIRAEQRRRKVLPGVYGPWARFRDYPLDRVKEHLKNGERFVLRLRSAAAEDDRITFDDRVRGTLSLPANPVDTVLLKSDGFPTYHFAHPVDDTLMGITLIVRGDEWINTTPIHLQIFRAIGNTPPPIAHIAPVAKLDGGSRRKLSKRLDAEASMDFYHRAGYPPAAIVEYLLNLLDSNFEEWRGGHPMIPYQLFTLSMDNLGRSSSLFDLAKLTNISRDVIARLPPSEVLDGVMVWARAHDQAFEVALRKDPKFSLRALSIGRDDDPPRKDLTRWSDAPAAYGFFFRDWFDAMTPACYGELAQFGANDAIAALEYFRDHMSVVFHAHAAEWLSHVKEYAIGHGYAKNEGARKKAPSAFKGTVSDFLMVLRVAVTGSRHSPDLHAVMHILGAPEVANRIGRALQYFCGRAP